MISSKNGRSMRGTSGGVERSVSYHVDVKQTYSIAGKQVKREYQYAKMAIYLGGHTLLYSTVVSLVPFSNVRLEHEIRPAKGIGLATRLDPHRHGSLSDSSL